MYTEIKENKNDRKAWKASNSEANDRKAWKASNSEANDRKAWKASNSEAKMPLEFQFPENFPSTLREQLCFRFELAELKIPTKGNFSLLAIRNNYFPFVMKFKIILQGT